MEVEGSSSESKYDMEVTAIMNGESKIKGDDGVTKVQIGLAKIGYLTNKIFNEISATAAGANLSNKVGTESSNLSGDTVLPQTLYESYNTFVEEKAKLDGLFKTLPGIDKSVEEQLEELKQLEKEDEEVEGELIAAINEAQAFVNNNINNLRSAITKDMLR